MFNFQGGKDFAVKGESTGIANYGNAWGCGTKYCEGIVRVMNNDILTEDVQVCELLELVRQN